MRLDEKASKLAAKRFLTLEEDMNKKHNFKYNYEKVIYLNNSTPIIIICPVHGDFEQLSGTHLSGCGCPKCGSLTSANTNKKNREVKYFSAFKEIHGDKYDYSISKYIKYDIPIEIRCNTCNNVFTQQPQVHKRSKEPCPHCRLLDTEKFIERAKEIHGNLYDYEECNFTHIHNKLKIICPTHGVFEQIAGVHLWGSGCPKCSWERTNYSRYKNKRTILYYIKIGKYFKIGLTQSGVLKRFYKEIKNDTLVKIKKEWIFEDGWEAHILEQNILKQTEHLKVDPEELESLIIYGKTEVRSEDIIEVIENIIKIKG